MGVVVQRHARQSDGIDKQGSKTEPGPADHCSCTPGEIRAPVGITLLTRLCASVKKQINGNPLFAPVPALQFFLRQHKGDWPNHKGLEGHKESKGIARSDCGQSLVKIGIAE